MTGRPAPAMATMGAMRRLLLLLVPIGLLTGCMSGSDDPEPDALEWPGESDGPTQLIDLGAGFSVEAPETWSLEQAFEVSTESADECGSVPASIEAGAGVFVSFNLPAAVCAGDTSGGAPLNGEHGDYVSIEDVSDPLDPGESSSELGRVTTFEQDYEECTQECVTTRDQVALVALSVPIEPDRPTLMIHADADEVSVERMLALVDALSFD